MTDSTSRDVITPDAHPGDAATRGRRPIPSLATGVPGLDTVLGGGLPASSFTLIAGAPGAGKTTLALQVVFANATAERPALYVSMVGEPTLKLLRYQQQFTFFRPELVGSAVHIRNLSTEVLDGDFAAVLARITAEVAQLRPSVVVIDSFRSINTHSARRPTTGSAADGRAGGEPPAHAMGIDEFIQRLAVQLTTWEVTSFLLGEYAESDLQHQIFTVADGILWLSQAVDRNSVVRKLQVTKMRGRAHMPGLHTIRITEAGVQVFPRIPDQQAHRVTGRPRSAARLATGVPGLDALMGGGIPAGDALMIAGPTGSGKTTFGMQLVADGLRRGEACVVAVFEEYPEDYRARLANLGVAAEALAHAGLLRVIYLRPLDLSVDETLAEILDAVRQHGASRVVIDSLSGFEVALAPTFREDFSESLYRLVGALTATGVTVLMTYELAETSPDAGLTGQRVSFITDDILLQRYVEIAGALRRVLTVVKMRRSAHNTEFWSYTMTAAGAVIGEPLVGYAGIQTGTPSHSSEPLRPGHAGLTDEEVGVLDALVRLGHGTPDALAAQVLVPRDAVLRALARLEALGYALPVGPAQGGPSDEYRPVARPAGP